MGLTAECYKRIIGMLFDIRYALRTLARNPGFAAVAILTLALGIGANTAIFTVFNRVLLHALPYPEADRLAAIQEVVPKFEKCGSTLPVNSWHFREWRKQNRSFSQLALVSGVTFTLTAAGAGATLRRACLLQFVPDARNSGGAGAHLPRGRGPTGARSGSCNQRSVVDAEIPSRPRSCRQQDRAGRDSLSGGGAFSPAAARIPSDGQLYSMAQASTSEDIWKPFAIADDELTIMGDFDYGCIGRLAPGVSMARASADLDRIQNTISQSMAEKTAMRVSLSGLQEQITGSSRASLTALLAGGGGAVLLIVVVNLANLLLARAAGRSKELAVRAAIGAGMGRLVRQMLEQRA